MTIPLQGRLAMSRIGIEFFHSPVRDQHALGEFYRLGFPSQDPVLVVGTAFDTNIPAHPNPISFSDFRGMSGVRGIDVIETNNNHATWWQYCQVVSTGQDLAPDDVGSHANWGTYVGGHANKQWFKIKTNDDHGTTFFTLPAGGAAAQISLEIEDTQERINSDYDSQGYAPHDGSGIRNCGFRLELPDGTLVHEQVNNAISFESGSWVNMTVNFNFTVDTATHGTDFVLRHTAEIYRNDDDARNIRWEMKNRELVVRSV